MPSYCVFHYLRHGLVIEACVRSFVKWLLCKLYKPINEFFHSFFQNDKQKHLVLLTQPHSMDRNWISVLKESNVKRRTIELIFRFFSLSTVVHLLLDVTQKNPLVKKKSFRLTGAINSSEWRETIFWLCLITVLDFDSGSCGDIIHL